MMKRLAILATTVATVCLAGAALANPLNTGVNTDGSLITPGSTDSAWTGVDVTQGNAALTAYAVSGYNGAWLTQPNAEFISPNELNGQADNYPLATDDDINWSQTFTLTSNGAASDIKGLFAVDNALTDIIINGHTVSVTSGGNFNYLTSFDIPFADLIAGSNTITFETVNFASESGNPTGLLVEFTQIPEPASAALLGAGMLALAMAGRRRKAV